jgi:hypothetical protein
VIHVGHINLPFCGTAVAQPPSTQKWHIYFHEIRKSFEKAESHGESDGRLR